MADALFLDSQTLGLLVDYVGTYFGAGLAIGLMVWMLGSGIYLLYDLLRGG